MRVVDPFGPGAGSSGGVVGALAPHVPENWNPKKAFQLDALLMAAEFWAGVEAASGRPAGYARSGRLQPLADERAVGLARARAETARALWRGQAQWRVIPAPEGWSPPSATGLVIHDTLSARIAPGQAVASLAAAVQALGGAVVEEAPDEGAVVWATGHAGLAELSAAFGRSVGVGVKGQAAVLGHDAGPGAPQLFIDGMHLVPHDDGTVALGSTTEREWDSPDGTDAALDALIARARAACPLLKDAPVLRRWAGVRPRAKSRAPLLGPWPGRPRHFIANGGFKIGFGVAPMVAQVMADLVLEGRDAIPPEFGTQAALG